MLFVLWQAPTYGSNHQAAQLRESNREVDDGD